MQFLKSCTLVSSMVFFSSVGFADCLVKITGLQSWPTPTEQALSCLADNHDFNDGLSTLCVQNKSEISKPYQKYLVYEQAYNEAIAKYRTAQDVATRSAASIEIQNAKQHLDNYGVQFGIFSALDKISSAHFSCAN